MSVITNNLLLGDDGYNISRSVRLRSSASAYFSRTPASAGNRTTWTWSGWLKLGQIASGTNQAFFGVGDGSSGNYLQAIFDGTSQAFTLTAQNSSSVVIQKISTPVYRDPSAWYHVVIAYDSTQATSTNRMKIYVNNVQITSFTTNTDPSLNLQTLVNSTNQHTLSSLNYSSRLNYFDGYMTEVNFVDGQQLTPSSFGETDSITGVWKPKKYTGTYGTNGFYLNFSDPSAATAAAIGKDYSGNGNNWTPNNISVTSGVTYDSMIDVPTMSGAGSNYAVLNPLYTGKSTLSNCNLTASGTTDLPTIMPDSGSWYFEISGVSKTWVPPAAFPSAAGDYNFGQRPFVNAVTSGYKALNTQNLPDATIKKGNAYFDATTYTGNGSSQIVVNSGSMQPDLVWTKGRSGASNHSLVDSVRGIALQLSSNLTAAEVSDATEITALNSNGFSVGNSSGAGYSTNANGTTYVGWQWKKGAAQGFDIVTYTGNGTTQNVSHSLGVAPKFIITKYRNAVNAWLCYHASLGAGNRIYLNQTDAAGASSTVWNNTAPTSSVFSVGDANTNASGGTYVAYLFAEVAGFSKFGSYTGNGSTDGPFVYTGFRPRYVLWKRTDAAGYDWEVHDTSRETYNSANRAALFPDLSIAEIVDAYPTDFVSNGFKVRNNGTGNNASGGTYIYAAFAENPFKNSLAR